MYVDDVIKANILAATKQTKEIDFNIGSGVETSINKLARRIAYITGCQVLFKENSKAYREEHPHR